MYLPTQSSINLSHEEKNYNDTLPKLSSKTRIYIHMHTYKGKHQPQLESGVLRSSSWSTLQQQTFYLHRVCSGQCAVHSSIFPRFGKTGTSRGPTEGRSHGRHPGLNIRTINCCLDVELVPRSGLIERLVTQVPITREPHRSDEMGWQRLKYSTSLRQFWVKADNERTVLNVSWSQFMQLALSSGYPPRSFAGVLCCKGLSPTNSWIYNIYNAQFSSGCHTSILPCDNHTAKS